MALNEELISINASHAIYVNRLASGLGNKAEPFVDNVSKLINERLQKEVGRNLTPLRRERLLTDIHAITSNELKQYTSELKTEHKEFGGYEAAFQARTVNSLLTTVETVSVSATVADRTAKNSLIKLGEGSYTTYNQMLSKYWKDNADQVSAIVANGFQSGITTRELANNIMAEVDGRLNKTKKQALGIARTGTTHYANQARKAYFEENEVIVGTRRIAVIDSATSQYCRGVDQTVVLKTDPNYRNAFAPFHPNCRTVNVPEIDGRYAQDDDEGDRASNFRVDGLLDPKPVSSKSIYYDELKKLDASSQDAVLGVALGKAFRKGLKDGSLTPSEFAKLTVNENLNKAYTVTELKALKAQDNILSDILNKQAKK